MFHNSVRIFHVMMEFPLQHSPLGNCIGSYGSSLGIENNALPLRETHTVDKIGKGKDMGKIWI